MYINTKTWGYVPQHMLVFLNVDMDIGYLNN